VTALLKWTAVTQTFLQSVEIPTLHGSCDLAPSQSFAIQTFFTVIDIPDQSLLLLEQDLGHHALVLMIQQVTMEYRHTLNNWVGKIQDHIN
jgi:cyclopropane fatty-acyl-phospholipid synthase-like methyltransferase